MRSTFLALALLLAYLLLVFLVFRFVDVFLWVQEGIPSTQVVNPFLLSVRQLKQLLEIRGVSYTGYVEKKELVDLVQASADVVQGEVDELDVAERKKQLSTTPSASYFTGAAHFYEEVEDTKDSVWLVQVVPVSRTEPLLDDYTWRVLRSQLAPFAIRTGIFDCRLDRALCNSKGWTKPLLLLSMPRGTKPRDRVIMRVCYLTRPNAIIEWLREQLSVRVKKVTSLKELNSEWLNQKEENGKNATSTTSNLSVKVLLLTHLLHPPLFLAALSIKFTGRITFGIFTVKKDDGTKINGGRVPQYLVVTPGKTIVYGRRKMEHFNLKSMNSYLKTVQPEMNDSFLCSLIFINMFAVFSFLQVNTKSWWRLLVASLWTVVVCNLLLFATWLVLLGALRWPVTAAFCDWCSRAVQIAALTDAGCLLRSDWVRLLSSTWVFVASLFGFGLVACRKVAGEDRGGNWWELDFLFRPQLPTVEHEDGILIERLAVPAFWLQPAPSLDYIRDLPTSTFPPVINQNSPQAIRTLMDSEYDSVVTQLSQGDLPLHPDVTDCAICLDKYKNGVVICTLPCSHLYHQKCIFEWLYRDNHHCPICRWPASKRKIH